MKQRFAALILTLVTLFAVCVSASAQDQPLTVKYVPRTQRGTLFYLDVYSGTGFGAAIFELRYDASLAEYRGIFCDDADAEAMAADTGGTVKIVYSSRTAAQGKLFRISFSQLDAGSMTAELRVLQAVDGSLSDCSGVPAYSLRITLDESGTSPSGSDSAKKSASSSGEKESRKGSGSTLSTVGADVSEVSAPADTGGVFRDFSKPDHMTWFLLGGAVVILAGLFTAAGYFIGKRRRAATAAPKEEPAWEPDGEEEDYPDEPDEPEPPQDPPLTAEEIFKELE